jgi:hypothetical protein
MVACSELEYGGIVKKLQDLEERFQVRKQYVPFHPNPGSGQFQ